MNESLIADRWVRQLYGPAREKAPFLFKTLTSGYASRLLSFLQFDSPIQQRKSAVRKMVADLDINIDECIASLNMLNSPRKLFERQIRYWQCRLMPEDQQSVTAPADAKMLIGSLVQSTTFFLKEKLFSFAELLGRWQHRWLAAFKTGDFAVFRLTPEKYHYNHFPVSGRIVDFYAAKGSYHSCNPAAVVAAVTPYSKNKRVVTIIDTDVPGGKGLGLVAMIEIVALMIGDIVQCYSSYRYENPQPMRPGLFVRKGQPKSLFRPGSSVDVLLFQKGRMAFDDDLLANSRRAGVNSRFTLGFRQPLVETDVKVRSSIGRAGGGRFNHGNSMLKDCSL